MLLQQGGVCLICNDPGDRQALGVDHCHATGLVRGILCDKCNRGLGYFKDNPELLIAASIYLEAARCLTKG